MKKFILYFLAILLVTVSIALLNDKLNMMLIFSSSNSTPYKMYRLFKDYPQGEIPIIGSSRAEAGYVPKELSDLAFNYGLSGSTFRETVFHLKQIVTRDDCKLVIVNLDPWGFGTGDFKGNYIFVADAPLVQNEPKIKISLEDKIPGIRLQGKTRSNIAQCLNKKIAVTKSMEDGAILQKISRNAAEWEYIISKLDKISFANNAEIKSTLENILQNNHKMEIVFAVSPIAKPWWNFFTGKEQLLELQQWLAKFDHVHVFDNLTANSSYELTEFMDLTHLNEKGARRFSKELKKWLIDNRLL